MKTIRRFITSFFMAVIAVMSFSSCDGLVYDDEMDCESYYKVRFRFDMNMLYADAFSTQVDEVNLYVFDTAGKLVWKGHEEGAPLAEEGYLMELPLPAGKYNFVAWCGKEHENAKGFYMDGGDDPQHHEHLRMTMHREYEVDLAHSTTDLHALFHGKVNEVILPDTPGEHIVTVPLVKDTNSIRIMLVHIDGKEISKDDFNFKITDKNGRLDHDNTIMDDEEIEYRAWAKNQGMAAITPLNATSTKAQTSVHSVVAELTTSRLQTCNNPILTVTRASDGEEVIKIPIIDYFLMVKGEYNRKMEDDEFLDRQDDYNMTFFMHEDGTWYKQVLDILSWRVVNQWSDL